MIRNNDSQTSPLKRPKSAVPCVT